MTSVTLISRGADGGVRGCMVMAFGFVRGLNWLTSPTATAARMVGRRLQHVGLAGSSKRELRTGAWKYRRSQVRHLRLMCFPGFWLNSGFLDTRFAKGSREDFAARPGRPNFRRNRTSLICDSKNACNELLDGSLWLCVIGTLPTSRWFVCIRAVSTERPPGASRRIV